MAGRLRLPTRSRDGRGEATMSLIEHLDELRSRIIKVGAAFVVTAIVAWLFRKQIFDFVIAPGSEVLDGKLYATSVIEPFLNDLKLALFTAFLLTIPVLLYQIWGFVAPAVGETSRVFTYIVVGMASSLFLAGVAFGYFVVLPISMTFLLSWGGDRYETITTAQYYLSFVSRFLLAFGLVFELPAATYVAARLELITAPTLRRFRRHAIVGNAVLAAILTPTPDAFTMLLMGGPMIAMYEASILIAGYVNPVSQVTVREMGDDEEADSEDGYSENGYEENGHEAEDYDTEDEPDYSDEDDLDEDDEERDL